MLNINQDMISNLDVRILGKQKNLLRFIACLMLIGGVLFILFPFISGVVLSIILGIVLICSSIAFVALMIKNRIHNFWPLVSGILVSVAYVVMGYLFITAPEFGIFTIATMLACLFCLGGVIRILSCFRQRQVEGRWMLAVIGILDLLIAWCFLSATPQASNVMVSVIVGIELIISGVSCFGLARLFSKSSS